MKTLRLLLLLAPGALALTVPSSARAWAYIDVTASEVLSVDPPRVRTTFDLSFAGYNPGGGPAFLVTPIEGQSGPRLLDCQAPASWSCQTPAENLIDFGPAGGSWPTPLTFSIITDQAAPCVRFWFWDPVLGKRPSSTLNSTYIVDACLVVDAPVPTRPSSWGSVKSLYR